MKLPRFALPDWFGWGVRLLTKPATPEEAYETVELVLRLTKDDPTQQALNRKLEETLHLGSSSLEAWGAIGHVFRSKREQICELIGETRVDSLIAHVEKVLGQR